MLKEYSDQIRLDLCFCQYVNTFTFSRGGEDLEGEGIKQLENTHTHKHTHVEQNIFILNGNDNNKNHC